MSSGGYEQMLALLRHLAMQHEIGEQ